MHPQGTITSAIPQLHSEVVWPRNSFVASSAVCVKSEKRLECQDSDLRRVHCFFQGGCHDTVSNSQNWLRSPCEPSHHHDKCPRSYSNSHTRSCFWMPQYAPGSWGKGHALNLHMPRWGGKINFNAQRKKLLWRRSLTTTSCSIIMSPWKESYKN